MTWKDVSIEKYERIATLQAESMSDVDLTVAAIAVIDGVTVKEVEEMPYSVLLLKARQLRFLQQSPIPSMVRRRYSIGGVRYVPTLDMGKITTAQFIDFNVRATDAPEDLAGLLSVILIPEGHSYNDGYDQEEVRKAIYSDFPIEDAMGLSAFFFALWKMSIRRLLRRSRRLLRQLKRKREKTEAEMKLIAATEGLVEAIEQVRKYY